jgi:type IV pilus assembly protein PilF
MRVTIMKKNICVFTVVLAIVAYFWCATAVALEAQPKKASYYYKMGLSFLIEGNYTRALIELTEAEKLDPSDPAILNYLGQAYFFKKKYDIAEQKYLKAIEVQPKYSEARNNLGVTYLEMHRWDDAVAQLTIVVEDIFYQAHDDACINLAIAHLGKGDYEKSLSLLRPLISRNPRDPVTRLTLGRVYFADNKPELAISAFKKAIELDKSFVRAHYDLALAYLKIKDTAGAKQAFGEVIRLAPDSEPGQLSKEYLDTLK